MKQIDYSKYSISELIDVKENIHPSSSNYSAFLEEMERRQEEIQQLDESLEEDAFSLAERKVQIVGYFQLVAAIAIFFVIGLSTFTNGVSALLLIVGLPLIILNAVAGYTAVKEKAQWYWLSILNQSLQVIGFSIGSVTAKYSGLGFIGLSIKHATSPELAFGFEFSPGFSFYKYTESLSTQWIQIDIVALIFIVALIKVKDVKGTINKSS
ncbi:MULTISPECIES: hypothetical protein [Pseudoalteromonas]|uniref:DUF3278 domain-containing protein n=1 Tax=Pseudoalteromonas obscura TaxID=3048491 RepID=A0ABT7EFK2_9GAMM|nr:MULTISPECIES: hypothetical protein [Pseudoalteromonas]MBQ4835701.1 hypothetical protein [Pseudoalteromonas luteoviolacea]MDK2594046.1 hypothetical protein [Pseudoalteromonas sp. P94(2023)]